MGIARFAGRQGYRHAHKIRRVAEANVELVFGADMTAEQREAMLRNCFERYALLVLDILWFTFRPRQRLSRWFVWEDSTRPVFEEGAQLLLTGHYGNWETLGQAYAALGQPLCSVAAPLKNRQVDRLFVHLRQRTGQTIIPKQGAARRLLQGLRQGQKLAVLLDQNTRPRDGGIFVPFFGLPVPVSPAPAALAVKTGTVVHTVLAVPDGEGVYHVTLHDTLRADPEASDPVAELTARMTRSLERVIREHPEPWCWMYKRWEHIPEGADPSKYPSYAHGT